jgi:D-sedoheptulose 7-phosphate isomerase
MQPQSSIGNLLVSNIEELRFLLDRVAASGREDSRGGRVTTRTLLRGNKLVACGNGGSAADASHFTTEFVCRYDRDRQLSPAISLAAQGGDLAAIGNDYDFRDVFARQVKAFGKPGDVLVAFTTSGHSENVRRALSAARQDQMSMIAFHGIDGGACRGLADIELLVETQTTARIQEFTNFSVSHALPAR